MSNSRIVDAGATITKADLRGSRLRIKSRINLDAAAFGHGVNAVVGEIEKELQQAIVIAPEQRQMMIEIGFDVDLVSF